MLVEYDLKGVCPENLDDVRYRGIFNTDTFSVKMTVDYLSNVETLVKIKGDQFEYLSDDTENSDHVMKALKDACCGMNSNVLDIGYVKVCSLE